MFNSNSAKDIAAYIASLASECEANPHKGVQLAFAVLEVAKATPMPQKDALQSIATFLFNTCNVVASKRMCATPASVAPVEAIPYIDKPAPT
jgi:hypothetical protein